MKIIIAGAGEVGQPFIAQLNATFTLQILENFNGG